MNEEWAIIKECTNYSISNKGRVKRIHSGKGAVKDRVLKQVNSGKYKAVFLYENNKRLLRKIHILVLESFVCPRPEGMISRHLDDNKNNNNLENLCWGTYTDNENDKIINGIKLLGENHHRCKFSDDVIEKVLKSKGTTTQIAEKYGMSRGYVSLLKNKHKRKYKTNQFTGD